MKGKIMKTLVMAAAMLVMSSCVVNAKGLYTAEDRPQEWCLAQNIYYEARGSSRADQLAVADVVMNRVQDARYPNSVCEVVQQGRQHADGRMKRNQCQFSWYCDGKSDWPTDNDAWIIAQQIAYNMITYGDHRGLTEGSTHYHANYVKPNWARTLTLTGTIGVHKFYRWEQ
jgi:spore germination cell wall hydrolase CwlJ-like protein